jgi:signal peptidase I
MNEQEQALNSVKGFSMWPFLKDGQQILVKKIALSEFHRGDLVLYRAADKLICHRLLRMEQKNGQWFFHCRGDASHDGEDQISEKMIEGKVAAVISGTKAINLETRWQRLWSVLILLLIAPLLASLNKIYNKLKKNEYLFKR